MRFALKARWGFVAGAVALTLVCGAVASRLGSEFIPNLNEGDIAVQALRIPATGLTQSVEFQKQVEQRLLHLPVRGGEQARGQVLLQRCVAAFDAPDAEGRGAIRVNGAMVERLHLEQAKALLARAD